VFKEFAAQFTQPSFRRCPRKAEPASRPEAPCAPADGPHPTIASASLADCSCWTKPTNDLDLDGLDRLERFVTGHARRHGAGQPRPRVSSTRTVNRVGARAGPHPTAGPHVRRRLHGIPGRTRVGPPDASRSTRSTPTSRRHSTNGRSRSVTGWRRVVRNARRKATDNDKFVRKFRAESSEKQAAKARQTETADRTSRRGRGTAQGVGNCGCPSPPHPGPERSYATLRGAVVRRGRFHTGTGGPP